MFNNRIVELIATFLYDLFCFYGSLLYYLTTGTRVWCRLVHASVYTNNNNNMV